MQERAAKNNLCLLLFTFHPHPGHVLGLFSTPLITPLDSKLGLLKSKGVSTIVVQPFTKEFAKISPARFAKEILKQALNAQEVWVGSNFKFGFQRKGSLKELTLLGQRYGFEVKVVELKKIEGRIVSSRTIRELLLKGEVSLANRLLGREYEIIGRVVRGDLRGEKTGFLTANLKVSDMLVPKQGVYAGYAILEKERHAAVINIGFQPTFGENKKKIEVHIIDFYKNLYDKTLRFYFSKRLRDEKTFEGIEALRVQIKKDIQKARYILGS
jgi:riboflavin kinase/FMN adenylyltransferase